MVAPVGARTFSDAMRIGADVFNAVKAVRARCALLRGTRYERGTMCRR